MICEIEYKQPDTSKIKISLQIKYIYFTKPKMQPIIKNCTLATKLFPIFLLFPFFMLLILICLFNNSISWTIKQYLQWYATSNPISHILLSSSFTISLYIVKKSFENYCAIWRKFIFLILCHFIIYHLHI